MPSDRESRRIDNSPHVKILGMVLDQQLRYDVHASRVAKRGHGTETPARSAA